MEIKELAVRSRDMKLSTSISFSSQFCVVCVRGI